MSRDERELIQRSVESLGGAALRVLGRLRSRHARWGEPRVTRAVDLTLLAGFGSEERFIRPLLETFPAYHVSDWRYIENQLAPLVEVKGQPDILRTLVRLREL